jgi:hypothetical protein
MTIITLDDLKAVNALVAQRHRKLVELDKVNWYNAGITIREDIKNLEYELLKYGVKCNE